VGRFSSWLKRLRSSATRAAGEYAAKKAVEEARGRAEALREELFPDGDPELAEGEVRSEVVERVRAHAEAERRDRKAARIEREARAVRELAALKEAHAKDSERD